MCRHLRTYISSLASDEWQHVGEASVTGEGADRNDAAAVILNELGQECAQHPHLEKDGMLVYHGQLGSTKHIAYIHTHTHTHLSHEVHADHLLDLRLRVLYKRSHQSHSGVVENYGHFTHLLPNLLYNASEVPFNIAFLIFKSGSS